MAFVPGSDSRELLVLLGGVAILFASLQTLSSQQDADPGRVVSRCADGSVIGLRAPGVRRRRGRPRGLRARFAGWAGSLRSEVREDFAPGDLRFVRVREGQSNVDPRGRSRRIGT